MKLLLIFLQIGLTLPAFIVHADELDEVTTTLRSNTIDVGNAIGVPLNHYALIRSKNDVCAVRFTELHRAHDARPATAFNSGEETLSASLEVSIFKDARAEVPATVKLERRPLVGIGRFAWQLGRVTFDCGNTKILWSYPTWVSMNLGGYKTPTVEIAPTAWTQIGEVQPGNTGLKWFSYDDTRQRQTIPLTELAGSGIDK